MALNRKGRTVSAVLSTYAMIGALTFGYSAASTSHTERAAYQQCIKDHADDPGCICISTDALGAASSGFVAGAVWPLYWTWTGFDWMLPDNRPGDNTETVD
jgi:hypothetical protein